jgi:hypothetical protein
VVGLAVYVRNDPVNFVDPDGRWPCRPDGEGGYRCDPSNSLDDSLPGGYSEGGWDPNGRSAGPSGYGMAGKLNKGVVEKTGKIAKSQPCLDFLSGFINRLGSKLTAGFSTDKLIENLSKADVQPVRSLGIGHYEHVTGDVIQMADSAYSNHYYNYGTGAITSRPGDEITVYLHATFHLAMSSSTGQNLTDSELYDALPSDLKLRVLDPMKGAVVGLAFATNCGPNAVPRN